MENPKDNVENLNEKLYQDFKAHVAGEWLDSIRKLQIETDLLHDMIEDDREALDGLKAVNYEGASGGSSDAANRMVNAMDNLQHSIANYAAKLAELVERKQEAIGAINKLDNELQRVIIMRRYIRNEPYQEIESELHYSKEWIMNQRRAGLAALFEFMPSEVRVNLPSAI